MWKSPWRKPQKKVIDVRSLNASFVGRNRAEGKLILLSVVTVDDAVPGTAPLNSGHWITPMSPQCRYQNVTTAWAVLTLACRN
jgi:hypothetical protein